MVSDFDVTIVAVLERHKSHPYKTENLMDVVCVLTAPLTGCSSPITLSFSSDLPIP